MKNKIWTPEEIKEVEYTAEEIAENQAKEQAKADLKASAKAKLMAGEPMTEEEANLTLHI